jgi:predicted AlkP superfamily phosphohydrolase/phosphomutase
VENLLLFLGGLNGISQRFWHYMDPEPLREGIELTTDTDLFEEMADALGCVIDEYYVFIDGLIGELVALAGEGATIAVVADHGYVGPRVNEIGRLLIGYDMHSTRGLLLLDGPRVHAGARADDGDLIDVAPTIAAAANLSLGWDTDGVVRDDLLID